MVACDQRGGARAAASRPRPGFLAFSVRFAMEAENEAAIEFEQAAAARQRRPELVGAPA